MSPPRAPRETPHVTFRLFLADIAAENPGAASTATQTLYVPVFFIRDEVKRYVPSELVNAEPSLLAFPPRLPHKVTFALP